MAKRTRASRTKRVNRDFIRGLAQRRLELIFKGALEQQRYDIAIESILATCRLFNIPIDGPGRSGSALPFSVEPLEKLMTDAAKRRDS